MRIILALFTFMILNIWIIPQEDFTQCDGLLTSEGFGQIDYPDRIPGRPSLIDNKFLITPYHLQTSNSSVTVFIINL